MEVNGLAVVIGAGGGIGSEIVLTLAANGVEAVICGDLNLEAAEKTVKRCRTIKRDTLSTVKAYALQVDVTNEKGVQEFIDAAHLKLGRIDYFINAAGNPNPGSEPLASTSLENFRAMTEVHSVGTFLTLRAVVEKMQRQDLKQIPIAGRRGEQGSRAMSRGAIVILASLASAGGYIGVGPYVAAKHAVVGLVQNAALENGPKGIRVNAVSPSFVSGEMINGWLDSAPEVKKGILSDLPLGRLADAGEIADAIVWLCSGSASYINGHNMIIDGGTSVSLAKGVFQP